MTSLYLKPCYTLHKQIPGRHLTKTLMNLPLSLRCDQQIRDDIEELLGLKEERGGHILTLINDAVYDWMQSKWEEAEAMVKDPESNLNPNPYPWKTLVERWESLRQILKRELSPDSERLSLVTDGDIKEAMKAAALALPLFGSLDPNQIRALHTVLWMQVSEHALRSPATFFADDTSYVHQKDWTGARGYYKAKVVDRLGVDHDKSAKEYDCVVGRHSVLGREIRDWKRHCQGKGDDEDWLRYARPEWATLKDNIAKRNKPSQTRRKHSIETANEMNLKKKR